MGARALTEGQYLQKKTKISNIPQLFAKTDVSMYFMFDIDY
jgi:hypothetical protein